MNIMPILKKIVPLVTTGTIALFMPAREGWVTTEQALKNKNWKQAAQNFVCQMTGIQLHTDAGKIEFDAFETLNPVDFNSASIPKAALWSSLSVEAISKIGTWIRSIWAEVK